MNSFHPEYSFLGKELLILNTCITLTKIHTYWGPDSCNIIALQMVYDIFQGFYTLFRCKHYLMVFCIQIISDLCNKNDITWMYAFNNNDNNKLSRYMITTCSIHICESYLIVVSHSRRYIQQNHDTHVVWFSIKHLTSKYVINAHCTYTVLTHSKH